MAFTSMDAWKSAMKAFAKYSNVSVADMQQRYILDEFASKIGASPYRDSLVLKGGFIVSNLLGIDSRTTKDIDMTFNSTIYDEKQIRSILEDIINVQNDTFFRFEIQSIKAGQVDDGYNGFMVSLNAIHDRTKLTMKLDISNNTLIYPRAIQFFYQNAITGEKIGVLSYCIENIIAEKFETTLDRGEYNTRMRDLFDIVMLKATPTHLIDPKILSESIVEVAKERRTLENLYHYDALVAELSESPVFNKNFEQYKKKAYPRSDVTLQKVFLVFDEIYNDVKALLPEREAGINVLEEKIQSAGERAAHKKREQMSLKHQAPDR